MKIILSSFLIISHNFKGKKIKPQNWFLKIQLPLSEIKNINS